MRIGSYDYTTSYAIMVDGELYGTYETEAARNEAMQQIKNDHDMREMRDRINSLMNANKLSYEAIRKITEVIDEFSKN